MAAPQKRLEHDRKRADEHQLAGRPAEAVALYRKVLARSPNNLDTLWGLGCALTTLKEYAEAADALSRLTELAPERAEAQHNLGRVLHETGQTDAAVAAFRLAAGRFATPEMPLGAIATIIPGASSASNQAILEARRAMGACSDVSPMALPSRPAPKAGERIRVGYVSSFFTERNWMKQVWALINHHDRARVEVHLFSDGPLSAVGEEFRGHDEDWFHNIAQTSNQQAAQIIADQRIDVLVDLNAYSKPSRLPVFQYRPAPVTVAWYNAYATLGLTCFDYLIGDGVVIPAEEEPYYTERILRLSGSYLPLEVGYAVPDVVPPPCLSRGFITFGCLAPQYKITPAVIAAFADVLKRCPESRLVLKNRFLGSPSNQRYVQKQFEQQGVDAARIQMDGPAEHFDFIAKYSEIDLTLDSFPYNGGTTTMESLWQGVPVLCFRGDRWASRISESIVRSAGLPEFVAADADGFRELAVRLANDSNTPALLARVRSGMRDHLRAWPICDVERFARNMEDVYQSICKW